MARTYTFTIAPGDAGQRLDVFLARQVAQSVSRAMIQRGIRAGVIQVAERAAKPNYKLRAGDVVRAQFDQLPSPPRDITLIAQPIPLEILFEDEELLVVNKPAGLVTHPAPGHWDGTLVNAVLWHLGERPSAAGEATGAPLARAGVVHRLDKDTSGLLLIAKTARAQLSLSRQLKARTIHRKYLALVEGVLPLDAGTINAPIGRHTTHRKVMSIRHLGGRTAVTHYRVRKRFAHYTLLDVALDTGRTHQIRVHLSHVGHPVAGDPAYSRHPADYWRAQGMARQLLHAYQLTFQHPATGHTLTIEAPIPEDMQAWVS
jgi:23S rRNA pseudouridine1911/1915/1917 synthase